MTNPIALNVRRLRGKHGLSQGDVAWATGLTRQAVSLIERGMVPNPRIDTMMILAKFFCCGVEELLEVPAGVEDGDV